MAQSPLLLPAVMTSPPPAVRHSDAQEDSGGADESRWRVNLSGSRVGTAPVRKSAIQRQGAPVVVWAVEMAGERALR